MFAFLFVICVGLSVSVIAWLLMRGFGRRDALQKKPDLPWTWRLIWPFVTALSPWCESFLSWPQRDRLVRFAMQVGIPPAVRPAQMVACLTCLMTCGAAAGASVMVLLGMQHGIFLVAMLSGVLTGAWVISEAVTRVRKRRKKLERELPFVLDIMTLCIESGLSLHGALQQAEQHGPVGPLRSELRLTLSEVRSGVPRMKALRALADRCDCSVISAWVATLIQSESMGMNISVLLREHAAQCRVDRLQRAEKLAMEAPVKMLLPLIGCIFPCTFIVLAFPIVLQMQQAIP